MCNWVCARARTLCCDISVRLNRDFIEETRWVCDDVAAPCNKSCSRQDPTWGAPLDVSKACVNLIVCGIVAKVWGSSRYRLLSYVFFRDPWKLVDAPSCFVNALDSTR